MELTSEQKSQLKTIGRKYNLKLVLVHGSFASGRSKRGSDLDIAVWGFLETFYAA